MIEEIVLIKADDTALQAKLVVPDNPEYFVVLLHAPAGGRHDKSIKKVARMLDERATASLIPDLTDETEGYHQIQDDEFLLARGKIVIDYFVEKVGASSVDLYLINPSESFVRGISAHSRLAKIYVEKDGNLFVYNEAIGAISVLDTPLLFIKS